MATEASLNKLVAEAKKCFRKTEEMSDKSDWLEYETNPEPMHDLFDEYTNSAEIFKRAVDLIEADSEKMLLHDPLLAFWAYYGYGMSLHYRNELSSHYFDEIDDQVKMVEDEDLDISRLMMRKGLDIANDAQLNLLYEQSLAYSIVTLYLEDQENYVDAYELYLRAFPIREMQREKYNYILQLGNDMFDCFKEALNSNVDPNWLTKKAPTAIELLEKLLKICDLAIKGNEDTLQGLLLHLVLLNMM